MAGDNRTRDKTQERSSHKEKSQREPSHREDEDVRARPDLDPSKKKTGEF